MKNDLFLLAASGIKSYGRLTYSYPSVGTARDNLDDDDGDDASDNGDNDKRYLF